MTIAVDHARTVGNRWGNRAFLIKYVVFFCLLVAAFEGQVFPSTLNKHARLTLAGLFLLYGIWALLPFRKQGNASTENNGNRWAYLAYATRVTLRTGYLLVLRISYIFCALAYILQAVWFYDSSILIGGTLPTFGSSLVAILDQTLPPLTVLLQFVFPDLRPVVWNYGNAVAILLRLLTYFVFVVIIGSVLKEVWLLGYNAKFAELEARRKESEMRGQ